jgi:cardiolipin synthase
VGYLRGFPIAAGAVGPAPYSSGNRVRLLCDGNEILPAAIGLISRAQEVVRVQTMLLHPDEAGEAITAVLADAAKRGVLVQLAFDWRQSVDGPPILRYPRLQRRERRQRLGAMVAAIQDAGGIVLENRPGGGRRRQPRAGDRDGKSPRLEAPYCLSANHVDHRKLMIADDRAAIVGGANIAREYLYRIPPDLSMPMDEEARNRKTAGMPEAWEKWLDAAVLVEGAVVADLVELFCDRWEALGGERVPLQEHHPARGEVRVRAIRQAPGDEGVAASYLGMAAAAEREIYVASPYVSYRPFLTALTEAAKRGVDVFLLFPGAMNDVGISRDIFRGLTREIVLSGVQVFENNRRMIHTKAMVVDRRWVHLGSFNCDYRSFVHDYELALLIDDVRFAEEVIQRLFSRYMAEAELLHSPYPDRLNVLKRIVLPFT